MKYFLTFAVLVLVAMLTTVEAAKFCEYKNTKSHTVFIKHSEKGDKALSYVEYDAMGKCMKRVSCVQKMEIEVEECSTQKITCKNKAEFKGRFPLCCIKC